jgi:hypothetical protein
MKRKKTSADVEFLELKKKEKKKKKRNTNNIQTLLIYAF